QEGRSISGTGTLLVANVEPGAGPGWEAHEVRRTGRRLPGRAGRSPRAGPQSEAFGVLRPERHRPRSVSGDRPVPRLEPPPRRRVYEGDRCRRPRARPGRRLGLPGAVRRPRTPGYPVPEG